MKQMPESIYKSVPSINIVIVSLPKSEDKLYLGIENERVHFIMRSVCIILDCKIITCELFLDTQNTTNQYKRIGFASFFMLSLPFSENSVTFASK